MSNIHISPSDELKKEAAKLARKYNVSVSELATLALARAVKEPEDYLFKAPRRNGHAKPAFQFIDLFAGIGGIRLAFERQGGECVFSSEWDKWAQSTYFHNFDELPHGDITKIDPADIPDHDVLTAGFPCQPFSIAGVSKKKSLGREHGFLDKTQGTLFFNVAKIIETKRPKMFLLENVKNLRSHDKGNTFRVIMETLTQLGYNVFHDVIDASAYVPQHRERIFLVGLDRNVFGDFVSFDFPDPPRERPTLRSILERKVDRRYTLTDKLWQYLQDYAEKHKAKGNGFGFGLVDGTSIARTLSARYYKDGSEILIRTRGANPRRLTPRECARLMGFPDDFRIVVSDTQAYRQFGNSVVVPVVGAVAKEMLRTLQTNSVAVPRNGRLLKAEAK